MQSNLRNFLPATGDLLRIFGVHVGGNCTLEKIQSKGIFTGIQHYFGKKYFIFFLALLLSAPLFTLYLMLIPFGIYFIKHFNITVGLILLIFLYFMAVPGGASHPRFRAPAMPYLILCSSFGISYFIDQLRYFGVMKGRFIHESS